MSLDRAMYNIARRGILPWLKGTTGSGPLSVDSQGRMIAMNVGKTYYVASNYGDDTNDGSSWDKAFKTLAVAFAASNTNIAASSKGWAARNTIFISGDTFSETLTVFPNKADVVGVGSYDANDMAGITGNHVIANAGNYGTRFFNVMFHGAAAAGPIVTLASTSSGIQFIDCVFDAPVSGTTNTIGVQATASPFLKIIGCRFKGPFSSNFITIGAGEAGGLEIKDCHMSDGADNGVVINSSATFSWGAIIDNNIIQCADLVIDENSDLVVVTRNIGISGEAVGSSSYDFNVALAALNYITGSDKTSIIPALA